MTQALTDGDGRVRDLLDRPLQPGDYRLEFDSPTRLASFFTKLAVDLRVTDVERSYHVPLLLAPYSMTTYRGTLSPRVGRLAQEGERVDVERGRPEVPSDDQLDRVGRRPSSRTCLNTTTSDSVARPVQVDRRPVDAIDVDLGLAR